MPDTQDFIAGYDPTQTGTMTFAEALQMVQAAKVAGTRGLIISTDDVAGNPDVPDPSASGAAAKIERFIWRRVMATTVIFYGWVPTVANNVSGPGMLKWVSITLSSIPDNAITNSKIANLAVTDDKIYSVAFAKVTGVPAYNLATDVYAAGNDLAGSTFAAPVVKANAITDAKLQSDSTDNTLRAVSVLHIKSGTAYYSLITNAAGNAVGWFLNYFAKLVSVSGLGTKFQIPRVNIGATGLEWVTAPILQQTIDEDATVDSTATIIPYDDTLPVSNEGKEFKTYSITPKSLDGKIIVEIIALVSASTAVQNVAIALFDYNAATYAANTQNAFAVGAAFTAGVTTLTPIVLRASINVAALTLSGGGAATIALRYGAATNTAYINQVVAGRKFGGDVKVAVKLTEVPA